MIYILNRKDMVIFRNLEKVFVRKNIHETNKCLIINGWKQGYNYRGATNEGQYFSAYMYLNNILLSCIAVRELYYSTTKYYKNIFYGKGITLTNGFYKFYGLRFPYTCYEVHLHYRNMDKLEFILAIFNLKNEYWDVLLDSRKIEFNTRNPCKITWIKLLSISVTILLCLVMIVLKSD